MRCKGWQLTLHRGFFNYWDGPVRENLSPLVCWGGGGGGQTKNTKKKITPPPPPPPPPQDHTDVNKISPLWGAISSLVLRTLPTIVTAHTFCAFRDFSRGTRTRGLTFIYFRDALSQHWLLRFLDTLKVMTPNAMDRKRKHNGRFISTKSKRKRVSFKLGSLFHAFG